MQKGKKINYSSNRSVSLSSFAYCFGISWNQIGYLSYSKTGHRCIISSRFCSIFAGWDGNASGGTTEGDNAVNGGAIMSFWENPEYCD